MDANERRDRATDEASQWWSRVGVQPAEAVSDADRAEFMKWLRESPLHVAEMLHIAHVHDTLGRFRHWESVAVESVADDNVVPLHGGDGGPQRREAEAIPRRASRLWAMAAGVAALALAATVLFTRFEGDSLSTARAERREVMLADGSVVKLEPETRLRVRFEARQRSITLEQGRALFRVAKDRNRPFRVVADDTVMRAVGTAFGVERKNRDVIVTVSEGKVAVGAEDEVLLAAGQQLTVQRHGPAPAPRVVDAKRELAWAEGRLVFDSAPLRDVAAEFNRYNHVQLRVADDALASRPVSGVFQASDPETLISFIRAGARVTVSREGNGQQIVIAPVPR